MEKRIPSSSQTVGPYFRIGLDYLIDQMPMMGAAGAIEIRGRVLDRDGAPVPDAMLEFWSAGSEEDASSKPQKHGVPDAFRRVATDMEGSFAVKIGKPVESHSEEDVRVQAPHMMVLVFARGLMRHLITRVYLEDEFGLEGDPVLLGVPAERRGTLIAKCAGANVYRWDVILQGADETVFFAW